MSPERRAEIGDKIIEEFYWAGKVVVYVNNFLSNHSFEEECRAAENQGVAG
jgi:hypothetical protein